MSTRIITRKLILGSYLSALLTALVPGVGEAACTQADLTGTWYATFASGDVVAYEYSATGSCKLVVNSLGTIAANTSCKLRVRSGAGATNLTVSVAGGKLTINSSCSISGNYKLNSGIGTLTLGSGQMARDGNAFTFTSYQGLDAQVGEAVKQ